MLVETTGEFLLFLVFLFTQIQGDYLRMSHFSNLWTLEYVFWPFLDVFEYKVSKVKFAKMADNDYNV